MTGLSRTVPFRARPRARGLATLGFAALALAGCVSGSGSEQQLVDRAALTVQDMMTQNVSQDPKSLLSRARAVLICPRVFKAGFFIGGEGGSCVMLARAGNGTWSYPAFYDIGSGSFGFQFGVQDSELMLLVMTDRGLSALMDSQIRLGGNASLAIASVGAGVQGSTTTAVGADIVAFAAARGLFGGVSLEGSVMSARIDENQTYYGQPYVARQIVRQMQGVNAGADPLRDVPTRAGNAAAAPAAMTPPGYAPGYAPSYQQSGPGAPPYQQPAPGYQPPSAPSYQPPAAPAYQPPPSAPPAGYRPPPAPAPSHQAPAPSGYQPPPGQYTYPPSAGSGPIQEQSLPPPTR